MSKSNPSSLPPSYKPFGPNQSIPENPSNRRIQEGYPSGRYRDRDSSNRLAQFPGNRYNLPLNGGCSVDENCNPIYDEALDFVTLPSNTNVVSFVQEHFSCRVCWDVLIEATICPCGHRFCRHCLETWLKERSVCPICQKHISSDYKQHDYDVDAAINSVSQHLSEEWNVRRQYLTQGSPHQLSPAPNSITRATVRAKQCIRKACEWFDNACYNSAVAFLAVAMWLYENVSLRQWAEGILFTCFVLLVWTFGDQIVTFIQYMFYAAKYYEKDVPLLEQTAVFVKHEEKSGVKPKYQEFVVLPDTVFAWFLEQFYKSN